MKPTRRGYGLLVIVLAGILLGAAFGARSLNAVVVPGLVALAAGAVQLRRAAAPSLDRSRPEPGFPGETRAIELTVEAAAPCRVEDDVGAGLTARGTTVETAGSGRITYEVTLERRGEHRLGPAEVHMTDAFGLFNRRFTFDVRTPILVYPPIRRLGEPIGLGGDVEAPGRGAFDHLREYVPGDSLRDIHWRTSAKRAPDELLVAEYTADEEAGVTVAAETPIASQNAADGMAAATASVAMALLDSGVAVGMVTHRGRLPERRGRRHRREILQMLARTQSGSIDDRSRKAADIVVVADEDGVRLQYGNRTRPFETMAAEEVGVPP